MNDSPGNGDVKTPEIPPELSILARLVVAETRLDALETVASEILDELSTLTLILGISTLKN